MSTYLTYVLLLKKGVNLTMISTKNIMIIMSILTCTLLAMAITFKSNNPVYHVASLWSLVIISIFISKFDILHPYFWCTGFCALYTSAYTIILIQGFETNIGYTYENTLLSIIALATIMITVGPEKVQVNEINFKEISKLEISDININRNLLKGIIALLVIILLICIIIISKLGIQNKSELISNKYISFRLATYLVRYITLYTGLYMVISGKKMKLGFIVIFSGIVVLLFSLFTAERDGIFRFILVTIASLFATKRINRKTLPLVLCVSVISVVILSYLKYFFVSGEVRTGYEVNGIIYNFLNSDFATVGANLQVLLNTPWTNSYMDYSLILTDLFAPFTLFLNSFNVSSWFNDTFYYGNSSRAFTLLGQGYIIGGYPGVIVLFIVVSLIIKVLYKKSKINEYWLTIYIYAIATVASSFRGNLSSIVSTIIRVPLIGLLGYIIIKKFIIIINRKDVYVVDS